MVGWLVMSLRIFRDNFVLMANEYFGDRGLGGLPVKGQVIRARAGLVPCSYFESETYNALFSSQDQLWEKKP
jgi:hypothetical protein